MRGSVVGDRGVGQARSHRTLQAIVRTYSKSGLVNFFVQGHMANIVGLKAVQSLLQLFISAVVGPKQP